MNYQKLRPVGPVKRRRGMPPVMRAALVFIALTVLALIAWRLPWAG